jgi:hypothetical protein
VPWRFFEVPYNQTNVNIKAATNITTTQKQDKPQDKPRRIMLRKEFRLAGDPKRIFSVPLGWKLSCQAGAFINDQIQSFPKNVKVALKTTPSTPTTDDGNSFQMVPCEKTIQAVKREPVRTHLDKTPRRSSLSFEFWELITQLKRDLEKSDPAGPVGGAAQVKSVAAEKTN